MLEGLRIIVVASAVVPLVSFSKPKIVTGTLHAASRAVQGDPDVLFFVHPIGVDESVFQSDNDFVFERFFFDTALNNGQYYDTVDMGFNKSHLATMGVYCPVNLFGSKCDQATSDSGRGLRRLLPYILAANNSFFPNELNNTELVHPATNVAIKTMDCLGGVSRGQRECKNFNFFFDQMFIPVVTVQDIEDIDKFRYLFRTGLVMSDKISAGVGLVQHFWDRIVIPRHASTKNTIDAIMSAPSVANAATEFDESFEIYPDCITVTAACGTGGAWENLTSRFLGFYDISMKSKWRVFMNAFEIKYSTFLLQNDCFRHALYSPYVFWFFNFLSCDLSVFIFMNIWGNVLTRWLSNGVVFGSQTYVRVWDFAVHKGLICEKNVIATDAVETPTFKNFWRNLTRDKIRQVGNLEGNYYTRDDGNQLGDDQFWRPGLIQSYYKDNVLPSSLFSSTVFFRNQNVLETLDAANLFFLVYDHLLSKQLNTNEMFGANIAKTIQNLRPQAFSGELLFNEDGSRNVTGNRQIYNAQYEFDNESYWLQQCGPLNLTYPEKTVDPHALICQSRSGVHPIKFKKVGHYSGEDIIRTKDIVFPDGEILLHRQMYSKQI